MSILKRLSRHRLKLIGLLTVCLLAALATCNLRSPRNDPRLDAIRTAGYPATLAELDAWYLPVPDAENAALIYTNVFALMDSGASISNSSSLISDIKLPPRGQQLAGDDRTAMADIIASNTAILKLLHSALNRTNIRYPIDLTAGFAGGLSHLAKVRQAVALLSGEALLHAANGEREQAFLSLRAAFHTADSLNAEPTLISQLVRFAALGLCVSRLENIENALPLTDSELAILQATLAHAERSDATARALAGERVFGVSAFDDRQMRFDALSGSPGSGNAPAPVSRRFKTSALIFAYQVTGLFAKDRAYYLDAIGTNISAAKLDYPQRFLESRKTAAAFNSPPNRFYIFSGMLLPALAKFHLCDADYLTRLRVAQTALAVERYRLAHGNACPASLTELVPAFLKPLPLDPCDGQPLRFKKLVKGYVVYGIGSDGKDDGGTERKTGSSANYDITFIVER